MLASKKTIKLLKTLVILVLAFSPGGCNLPASQVSNGVNVNAPQNTPESLSNPLLTDTTFVVKIPASSPELPVYLDVLDEVTGLSYNQKRYPMEKLDEQHYVTNLAFDVGELVKYKYYQGENPIQSEATVGGLPIYYRTYFVQNSTIIQDSVASWSNQPNFTGESGQITGKVTDVSGNPIPGIMVTAGGIQTFTASNGSFLITGLGTGENNLVAFSLEGDYLPFQQGALVAHEAITPAEFQLQPVHKVKVTFLVSPPADSIPGSPIRLMGNLYSLGNVFSEIEFGSSTLAARAPLLNQLSDGRYTLTLELPTGYDLQYKYSLGDGYWNGELNSEGNIWARHLLVPDSDVTIEDTIITWSSTGSGPIAFRVAAPSNTPQADIVSIQFNSGTWSNPIPMWPLGTNNWLFILYGPFSQMETIEYRFCRNDQCGMTDDIRTAANSTAGMTITVQPEFQTVHDTIPGWAWYPDDTEQSTVTGVEVNPRGSSFMAGIEFSPFFDPKWQAYLGGAINNIINLGANWVILSPTWSITNFNQPMIQPVAGNDPLWQDMVQMTGWAHESGLNYAFFPRLDGLPLTSFQTADESWWLQWFDQYDLYMIHHADLASRVQAGALIIGDPAVLLSITGENLDSGIQALITERWVGLVSEIRSHYNGTLIMAVEYSHMNNYPIQLLSSMDQVYVLFSEPLTTSPSNVDEMSNSFSQALDTVVLPFSQAVGKPVIIGIQYPSSTGADQGCVQIMQECMPFALLDTADFDFSTATIDLSIQKLVYETLLQVINQRNWVTGFVSRGYYPPAGLMDGSFSIHDKPTSAVLWYWFPRLISP
jgi:hypothetical protein